MSHWAEVKVQRVEQDASGVQVWACAKASVVACPGCDCASARVHSRYDRRVADAAIVGRPVVLRLQVRRLFCANVDCPIRTFAEQIPGLTTPYARRSPVLRGMLESVGLALAGRAGERLARSLGLPVSRDTLVRLVRSLADPPVGTVTVLGVDDFAVKRGQNYATIRKPGVQAN